MHKKHTQELGHRNAHVVENRNAHVWLTNRLTESYSYRVSVHLQIWDIITKWITNWQKRLYRVAPCANSYQGYSKVNILNRIEPLRSVLRSCFVNIMVTIHVHTNSRSRSENVVLKINIHLVWLVFTPSLVTWTIEDNIL